MKNGLVGRGLKTASLIRWGAPPVHQDAPQASVSAPPPLASTHCRSCCLKQRPHHAGRPVGSQTWCPSGLWSVIRIVLILSLSIFRIAVPPVWRNPTTSYMSLLDKLVIVLFPRADSSTFRIQVGGLVLLTGFQGRRRRGGGGCRVSIPPVARPGGIFPALLAETQSWLP